MEYGQALPFTAVIDIDGTIYEIGMGRKRNAVGIDTQKEQEYITQISEMQSVIDNYFEKLVELGAIVPPKSAEEIAREAAAEQAEINRKMIGAITALTEKIEKMEGVHVDNELVIEPCERESGDTSPRNRDERGRYKKRDSQRTQAAS